MVCVRWLVAVCWTAAGLTSVAWGQVASPRVVAVGSADTLSITTWARSLGGAEVSNRDFALRLLASVTHPSQGCRLQAYGPLEGADPVFDYARVTDPVKLRQVFGWGDERQLAGSFVAVWEASGRGRGRLVTFEASPHVLAEIEADGVWWVFDVARHTAFPTSDSQFATFNDLKTQAALWQRKRDSDFYADSDPEPLRKLVTTGTPLRQYDAVATGFSTGITLRRGERWTWFAAPQGSRWVVTPHDLKNKAQLTEWSQTPTGPKDAAGRSLYTNGVVVYEPSLTPTSDHLADGALVSSNLEVTAEGLRLQKDGVGWAIFSVQTPGPIVPELGKLEDAKDDKLAATLDIDGKGIGLSVSPDNAATWISLEAKEFPAQIDLTPQVSGRYSYLLRVEVSGKVADVGVKHLKLTTWFQTSPRTLPALTSGANRFQLLTNDEYGLPTRSFTPPISTRDDNAFLAPVIRPPRGLQAGNATERVVGPFTLRITPPLGTQLAWFRLGGRFAVVKDQPALSAIELGTAVSQPLGFEPIPIAPTPPDHHGADRQIDRVIRYDEAVPAAYVRVEGRPALNDLRVMVYGVDPTPQVWTPWTITHRWREGELAKEHVLAVTAETTDYEVRAGNAPVVEALEFFRP